MSPEEAERQIRQRIVVTPQRVMVAKAIILDHTKAITSTDDLIAEVLRANSAALPKQVLVHESVDSSAMVIATGEALSWRLAAAEGIWSLIHAGLLFAVGDSRGEAVSVGWTTVVPGSGGTSSGWRFEECNLPVPSRVRLAPSTSGSTGQFLAEPDLYLHTLGITNMHPEVLSSFQEAVRCFRAELFTAALAMLGKASEGSWLELGVALLRLVPPGQEQKFAKQRATLEDSMAGTFRKIEAVLAVFDHQDLFAPVAKASGVRLQELRSVAVWSDAVRDSRNTIHFGVNPAVPNTYEKLAALFIGAVPNVRILYRVKAAADAI